MEALGGYSVAMEWVSRNFILVFVCGIILFMMYLYIMDGVL